MTFWSCFWHLSRVFERAEETWRFLRLVWTVVWLKATKGQERQLEFTGSAKNSLCERVVCWWNGSSWFLCRLDTRGTRFYLTWGFLVEFRFSRFQGILVWINFTSTYRWCSKRLFFDPKTAQPKMHMYDVLISCNMEGSQLSSPSVPPGWEPNCVEDTHCIDGPPEGSSPGPTHFVLISCPDFIGYLAISSSLWIKATAPSPPRNR